MTPQDLIKELGRATPGCPPEMEERLRLLYREESRRAEQAASSPGWFRWWPGLAVAAAAAALVFWAPQPPSRLSEPAAPAAAVVNEVYTDFYALDAGAVGMTPRGAVMRVRVPRATMRQFGLPVNPEMLADRVEAEVLLGNEGTARAIRFVSTLQ
ncbi:MAG: hypothetical protein NTV70_15890 [Acidobacteria bacterium]|nr:hypothetical protein [Acidobacteriota bacterium]